jgi:hypothetical protein
MDLFSEKLGAKRTTRWARGDSRCTFQCRRAHSSAVTPLRTKLAHAIAGLLHHPGTGRRFVSCWRPATYQCRRSAHARRDPAAMPPTGSVAYGRRCRPGPESAAIDPIRAVRNLAARRSAPGARQRFVDGRKNLDSPGAMTQTAR